MDRDYNQRRSRTSWSTAGYYSLCQLITFILLFQLTYSSSSPQSYGSEKNGPMLLQQSQRPKFSSKITAQTPRRRISQSSSTIKHDEDLSGGFPNGFTQGLPTFDFSGPMVAEATSNNKGEQIAVVDADNIGFVNGPPDGFPTLEQLGGKFPGFSSMPKESPSGIYTSNDNNSPPPKYPQQVQQHQAGSTSYQIQHNRPNDGEAEEDYLSGPGPSSIHHQVEYENPKVALPLRRPHLKRRPQSQSYRPEVGGSSRHPQYLPAHSSYPQQQQQQQSYQPKRPVVLKVSGKKVLPTKLPPGPPIFFAPSPDIHISSSQQDSPNRSQRFAPSYQNPQRFRYKRSENFTSKKNDKSDQLADGSTPPDTFWEVTSPFILFDTYKTPENLNDPTHLNEDTTSSTTKNVTLQDHDSGEQRFFPSFPAPNPYLGLSYSSLPSRPPLFPGPTSNRAPSRYHPQFGGPNKYNIQSSPPINRGPSGVYTAESHDHDRYQDNNLLGSGNFEVIRGGTYYEDDDAYNSGFHGGGIDHHGGVSHHHGDDGGGEYYHHNGHSSPPGYRSPGTDFFANFRDFADINPPSRSYSHRHETLASHPATGHRQRQPKNILEKLESSSDSIPAVHHTTLSRESDPMMATF